MRGNNALRDRGERKDLGKQKGKTRPAHKKVALFQKKEGGGGRERRSVRLGDEESRSMSEAIGVGEREMARGAGRSGCRGRGPVKNRRQSDQRKAVAPLVNQEMNEKKRPSSDFTRGEENRSQKEKWGRATRRIRRGGKRNKKRFLLRLHVRGVSVISLKKPDE